MPPYISTFISHLQTDTVIFTRVRKLAKKTLIFMSVCLSVRMEQLVSHRTDFYEICYLGIFRNISA